jgi:lysophospholipase L1-like esterase
VDVDQLAAPVYVALGDSISIDDYAGGPGRGGASLLFRNRDEDFPQWQGRDVASLHPDARFFPLASDGATTRTVTDVQLPLLAALPAPPTLVTLTVGGNDLLSAYGDTAAARAVITGVQAAVARTLETVAAVLAPAGRLVVGTVYDPSDGTADADRLGLPPWPDVVGVIGELNDALREVAGAGGAAVAEIGELFHGHGLLAGDITLSQARPTARDVWLCSVIEPNAWGASGVREAFWLAAGLEAVRGR